MRVLIACEFTGRVREAFRRRGHEAYSCDLEPAEDGSEFHLRGDAVAAAYGARWDLMIAHPPCTHLAAAGARWFAEKIADGRQAEAIAFVRRLAAAPIARIAIENPMGVLGTLWRVPDQTIQPWQFGHGETKATCLWLKGLPLLRPTLVVPGRRNRIHNCPDSSQRARRRSRTFEGIAQAMADQWGNYADLVTQAEVEMYA
jgi:site-specific DNA-cytosine methylase